MPDVAMSVLVPTYRRPDYLRACLASLLEQDFREVYEVIVVHRADDSASRDVVEGFADARLRTAIVATPGALAALRLGLVTAQGIFVAFTDDDATYPRNWLRRLTEMLSDSEVVGAGGMISEEGIGRDLPHTAGIAQVTATGRARSNLYDRRPPAVVDVDFLPGANMAFRRDRLDPSFLPDVLQVAGGAPGFEMLLAGLASRSGGRVLCDTGLRVLHHRAPRVDASREHERSAVRERARSRAFVMRQILSRSRLLAYVTRMVLVGDAALPGIAVTMVRGLRAPGRSLRDFGASLVGLAEGFRLASRRPSPPTGAKALS